MTRRNLLCQNSENSRQQQEQVQIVKGKDNIGVCSRREGKSMNKDEMT